MGQFCGGERTSTTGKRHEVVMDAKRLYQWFTTENNVTSLVVQDSGCDPLGSDHSGSGSTYTFWSRDRLEFGLRKRENVGSRSRMTQKEKYEK